jgi:hypothetical protein
MSAPDRICALLSGGELTPAERAILSNLVTTARRTALAKAFSSEADRDSRFRYLLAGLRYFSTSALVKATEAAAVQSIDPEYISKSSGIPYAALQAMAAALAQKLNIETASSLRSAPSAILLEGPSATSQNELSSATSQIKRNRRTSNGLRDLQVVLSTA